LNKLSSHVIELAGAKKLTDSSLQIADVLQNIIQTYTKTLKRQVEDVSRINNESHTKLFHEKLIFIVEQLFISTLFK